MGDYTLFKVKSLVRDLWPPAAEYLPENYPDLTGKVALVTGASAGVGLATTKLLASKNCHVFLGVRSEAKARAAIEKILKELGDNDGKPIGKLEIVVFDLADLTTIKRGADELISKTDKLNIIIHNAGVMLFKPGFKTAQGYDLQFGTNVVGPFLLQKYIDPLFLKPNTTFKRIVWVSSVGHNFSVSGGINWDVLGYDKRPNDLIGAYGQSKAGDIILAALWPTKHTADVQEQNIVSVSVHPGYLVTELGRDLSYLNSLFIKLTCFDAKFGAYTELFALLNPSLTSKDNGSYIIPWGVIGEPRPDVLESITNGNGEKLWDFLAKETASY